MDAIQLKWSDNSVLFKDFEDIIEKNESLFEDNKDEECYFFPDFKPIAEKAKDFFEWATSDLNSFKVNEVAFASIVNTETNEGFACSVFYKLSDHVIISKGDGHYEKFSIDELNFHSIIEKVIKGIRSFFSFINKTFKLVKEGVSQTTVQVIENIRHTGGNLMKVLKNVRDKIVTAISNSATFIIDVKNKIKTGISTGVNVIKGVVSSGIDIAKTTIGKGVEIIKKASEKVVTTAKKVVEKTIEVVKDVKDGIVNGVKKGWNWLKSKF